MHARTRARGRSRLKLCVVAADAVCVCARTCVCRSRLKLELEAHEMRDATFSPNLARAPPDRPIDVAALSPRLHRAAVARHERHRRLQVTPPPSKLSAAGAIR